MKPSKLDHHLMSESLRSWTINMNPAQINPMPWLSVEEINTYYDTLGKAYPQSRAREIQERIAQARLLVLDAMIHPNQINGARHEVSKAVRLIAQIKNREDYAKRISGETETVAA